MRLSQINRGSQQNQQGSQQNTGGASGVRNVATYQHPFLASYDGELVNVIATGDHPDFSPVLQFVDSQGQTDWATANDIKVVDTRLLPPNKQAVMESLRQIRG